MAYLTGYASTNNRKEVPIEAYFNKNCARSLLIISTAICAIFTVVPGCSRLAASLAMRGFSCLSSVEQAVTAEDKTSKIINVGKVATVCLGIVGVALASPVFLVASIASDMALHIIEGCNAIYERQFKKLPINITMLIIDSLVLSGIILGSWQLMVAAAVVTAVAMGVFLAVAIGTGRIDSAFSSLALLVVSALTAFSIAERTAYQKKVVIKNDDPTGKITVMKPVESGVLAEGGVGEDVTVDNNTYVRLKVVHTSATGDVRVENYSVPEVVVKPAMAPAQFNTLPLGSTSLNAVPASFDVDERMA